MDCTNVKIIDTKTGIVMGRIQWLDLKASVQSHQWSAHWGRTRTTSEGDTLVLRSTDLSEAWTLLDIFEGSIDEITFDHSIRNGDATAPTTQTIDRIYVTGRLVETRAYALLAQGQADAQDESDGTST